MLFFYTHVYEPKVAGLPGTETFLPRLPPIARGSNMRQGVRIGYRKQP